MNEGEQEGSVCASLSDLLSLLIHLFLSSWSLTDSLFGQGGKCSVLDSYFFFIWKKAFY